VLNLYGPDSAITSGLGEILEWIVLAAALCILLLIVILIIRRDQRPDKNLMNKDLALLRIIRDNATLILNDHQRCSKIIPINGGGKRGN
jgi:hypothetical protein